MNGKTSETIPTGSRGPSPETVRTLYYLRDPRNFVPKYVGSTVNTQQRLRQHLSEAKQIHRTLKQKWILTLLRHNLRPVLVELGTYESSEAFRLEKWLIHSEKLDLLNYKDHALGRVRTKLVHQFTLGGEFIDTFANAGHAEEVVGVHNSAILQCCKRKAKSAKGFQWSFGKTLEAYKPEKCRVPVYCIELNVKFPSGRKASKETKIDYKRISACINGRQKTAGGYHWVKC